MGVDLAKTDKDKHNKKRSSAGLLYLDAVSILIVAARSGENGVVRSLCLECFTNETKPNIQNYPVLVVAS